MKTNVQAVARHRTHEGAVATPLHPVKDAARQLRRSVMSCLLFEQQFYENGEDIAARIEKEVAACSPAECLLIADEARNQQHLRHVPLWIAVCMASNKHLVGTTGQVLDRVIQRADEITELWALYAKKNGRRPMPKQFKLGLARAFNRFDAYQLSKYDGKGSVKLRTVLRLCHAKPKDDAQSQLFKGLLERSLTPPNTWESRLTSGEDKKAVFEDLLRTKKLGGLALLRNIRGMHGAGVGRDFIFQAIVDSKYDRVLPFRFIAAARAAPEFEPALETAMLRSISEAPKLMGHTLILVDVSGSMDRKLSSKSDLTRIDAACGVAIVAREVCPSVEVVSFSDQAVMCPPRRGFALRDSIKTSQPHGGTQLGAALAGCARRNPFTRTIVITDEQSQDTFQSHPTLGYLYVINVASAENGVSYRKDMIHVDGWSEAVIRYITEMESSPDALHADD